MSVSPYDNPTNFPGAQAIVTDPPSLAGSGAGTDDGPPHSLAADGASIPAFTSSPWSTILTGEELIITASTGGSTGTFELSAINSATELYLVEDPSDGFPVTWHCTPAGRSGLNDLATRLQNGYEDANGASHDPIPSTIIGGKILTEAPINDGTIAAY